MSPMDEFDSRFSELAAIAYRVSYRLLGDREEARDIAQEALTRAYVRWRRVKHYPEPWVARVASNLSLGVLRKRRPDGLDQLVVERDQDEQVVSRLVLAAALRGLPRRQRDVVVLRYLADLSERDVADLLGCAQGTVKSHAHRGLRALRGELGDNALQMAGGTP